MDKKPTIIISQRVDTHTERAETRDGLDQRLIELVLKIGALPIPVPNMLRASTNSWLSQCIPDGIILSGGNDIGESFERDETEAELLKYAISNRLPLLGICRGMQFLAKWSGAKLHPVSYHVQTRHEIFTDSKYGPWPKEVNSFHKYSISNCPTDYLISATTLMGEIEAIKHKYLPWEGWMWHPERENPYCEADILRMRMLFIDGFLTYNFESRYSN